MEDGEGEEDRRWRIAREREWVVGDERRKLFRRGDVRSAHVLQHACGNVVMHVRPPQAEAPRISQLTLEDDPMNVSPTARQLFVATLMLAAAAASPLLAQHYQDRTARRSREASPLIQKMEAELGQAALDYWTPKLNQYKISVDQTLSAEDLAALNRLGPTVHHRRFFAPVAAARERQLAESIDGGAIVTATQPDIEISAAI